MSEARAILEVANLMKRFPGVTAVDDVSFSIDAGETLALIGENGAGKSTLTQMLCGVLLPDAGTITLDGELVAFTGVEDAIRHGVSSVFQELSLVGGLSIAENIFANRQPVTSLGKVRWKELYEQTRVLLREFELDIDPRLQVRNLSVGQQQMIEILKAVSTKPKLLLLDEPTSSLTESETAHLFATVRRLKAAGMSFIYITHKLAEVFELADEVIVLRDGHFIDKRPLAELTEDAMVAKMVGRNITQLYGEASGERQLGEPFFHVEGLSGERFRNATFSLRKGEILGFAGLVGAGRTELARAIVGADPSPAGTIRLYDEVVRISSPADAIAHKIAYLTEDRKGVGLFLERPIKDNLAANRLGEFSSRIGVVQDGEIAANATRAVADFRVAAASIEQKVMSLSGGNQQKVLIAEWLGIEPEVIIFDEPTRGVDVGARADIYHKIKEYADLGHGVILISSELSELLGMCDRILVMYHGQIVEEVNSTDFSEELVVSYAAGLTRSSEPVVLPHERN